MEISILVTSAGTASATSVIRALKLQKQHKLHIVAVDADRSAAGLYLADEYTIIPPSSSPAYMPALLDLCRAKNIKAVFPIHSSEIEIVAKNAALLQKEGVATLLSDSETITLCNDKKRMYAEAEKLGLTYPRVYAAGEIKTFPVFMKPNTGSGTHHVAKIGDQEALEFYRRRNPDALFQECVDGAEYTVDCLCDRESNLVVASPRSRLSVKAGQTVKGLTESLPELEEICRKVCNAIHFRGPCNLQFIRKADRNYFIELNPRYAAGGLMLTVEAGANTPLLALELMLGLPVAKPVVKSGVLMVRYWQELFLES